MEEIIYVLIDLNVLLLLNVMTCIFSYCISSINLVFTNIFCQKSQIKLTILQLYKKN